MCISVILSTSYNIKYSLFLAKIFSFYILCIDDSSINSDVFFFEDLSLIFFHIFSKKSILHINAIQSTSDNNF